MRGKDRQKKGGQAKKSDGAFEIYNSKLAAPWCLPCIIMLSVCVKSSQTGKERR